MVVELLAADTRVGPLVVVEDSDAAEHTAAMVEPSASVFAV